MSGQILRLTDEESQFVKNRYPFINYDEILCYADGMTSMTNLDLMIMSIRSDMSNFSDETKAMASSIIDKAEYFKNHNGQNRLEGYDLDYYCEMAEQIGKRALNTRIGNDIFKIDQIINFIRMIKKEAEEEGMLERIAMTIGIKLGTIMLSDKLADINYDWNIVEGYDYPCICNDKGKFKCDVIGFIKKKLEIDSSTEDNIGTCSDFYFALLDSIKESID